MPNQHPIPFVLACEALQLTKIVRAVGNVPGRSGLCIETSCLSGRLTCHDPFDLNI